MKHEGSDEEKLAPSRYDIVMNPEYAHMRPMAKKGNGFAMRSKSTVIHRHTIGRSSLRSGLPHRATQPFASLKLESCSESKSSSETPESSDELGSIDPRERISNYLHMNAKDVGRLVSPADRIQHVHKEKNPRPRILYYDRMTAFLYTPGDPTTKWYCHSDGKIHNGLKPSSQYVALIKFIGTHDSEKDDWSKSYEYEEDLSVDARSRSVGQSLPCTPRHSKNGDIIRRNRSATELPQLIQKMEKNLKNKKIKDLPKVYVSWFGVTNGKAIIPYMYDGHNKFASFNVSTYTQTMRNFGMHKNVPVYLPSCFLAQEGGYRSLRPCEAGRECAVFMKTPKTDRDWKCEFGGHDYVYVKSERMYRIDEAYIDMDNPLDPLKSIVMD